MGHLHPRALTGVPAAIVAHVPAARLRIALSRIAFAVGAAARAGAASPVPAPYLHRALVVASAGGDRPLINVRPARPRRVAGEPPGNVPGRSPCSHRTPSHGNTGEHS